MVDKSTNQDDSLQQILQVWVINYTKAQGSYLYTIELCKLND